MSVRISRDKVFFAFSPALQSVAHVKQGQEVVLETHDCFQGQLKSESDQVGSLDWSHINPATGPVYIEGTKPGDILRVDILEVSVGEQSVMVTIPGEGVLGDMITEMETVILPRAGEKLSFRHEIKLPVRPMIGVIGVAPADGEVPNGTPGPHGGNMDCKLITTGVNLYFTVGVEGALLGAGDLHAAMGDGEVVVCGAESAGEVRLRAEVVDLPGLPTPFLENDEIVAVIAAAPTADEAAAVATHRMASFLTDFAGIPINEAGMLMSLVGELKFCQVVDPLKTVRFEFPRWVLRRYGYRLP